MLTTFVLEFTNVNDKSRLQSNIYIFCEQWNLSNLESQGLTNTSLMSKDMTKGGREGTERVWNIKLLMEVALKQLEGGDNPESFCVKAANKVSSMASKGLFVCFQVAINKTEKQQNILKNGSTLRANRKMAAFNNAFKLPNKE
jgi:hypothetical protein